MKRLGVMTRVLHSRRLIIAGMLASSLGAAGCGGASSTTRTGSSSAAPAITTGPLPPPASLLAPAADLPGFHVYGAPQAATSTRRWAEISNESDEVEGEVKRLTVKGFREGVGQHYKSASGQGAISLGLVFDSPRGAHEEVTRYLGLDPRYGLHVEDVKDSAIPGSVIVGEGAAGDVLFTTGRCFLLIGGQLGTSGSQAQVNAITIPAASAVYARVRGLCS
jgi:hypothetical protein